jgi:serine protease Do
MQLTATFFRFARALCLSALCASATLALNTRAQAQTSAPKTLARTVNAVVGVKATAVAGARSAETLGMRREGSGILIDTDGHILTIGYLLIEADSVVVETDAGLKVPASVVAYDQASGFGLVKAIAPLKIEPALIGSSAALKASEAVLTVSGGEDGGVSEAQVVSKRPFAAYWEYLLDEAVFTAPARADHSGAALVNSAGELVGIGSLFVQNAARDDARMQGNMFIPIDLLKPILAELKSQGASKASNRPWLGLSAQESDGRLRVMRVSKAGPAEAAGVEAGDLVLAINGLKIDTLKAFYQALWKSPAAETEVELTVLKGTELRQLKLKAKERTSFMIKPTGV